MSRAVLVLTCCVVAAGHAQACGLCHAFTGNPLSLPHPRAIEIAVATRAALDRGVLRTSAEGNSNGWSKRPQHQGAELLRTWMEQLNRTQKAGCKPGTLHLVLIDTGETWAIHQRSGQFWFEPRAASQADTALATTSHLLRAVLVREMDWEKAEKQGLVVLEGNRAFFQGVERY